MDYTLYSHDAKIQSGKAAAYKNYLIKNIEIIGQRKLVVIGGEEDYGVLMSTISQLRAKNVKVPEIAFRACIKQNEATEDGSVRFIEELRGKVSTLFVLILAPYPDVEIQVAAMAGVIGTSAGIAAALKSVCGYTERDFLEMNQPTGLGLNMAVKKAASLLAGEAKRCTGLENSTASQLSAYKDKMKGQRCFIMGSKGAKLDELNVMMNERTFAYDNFCDFFARTPQRPAYYLLTDPSAYLGNGKYIEGMECFVNANVKVFEDKFKKKPTYVNPLGKGLIDGLPTFDAVLTTYETAVISPMYQMLQLALYMGFSDIYIYGFDGIFDSEIDSDGIARNVPEGEAAGFPDKTKQVLERVATYAENNKINIHTFCETSGLSMFDKVKFEDIDFSSSAIFGKL